MVTAVLLKTVDLVAWTNPTNMALARLLSTIARELGDEHRFRDVIRQTFEALSHSPASLTSQLSAYASRPRSGNGVTPEQASTALKDLERSAPIRELRPFLAFGSLLGAVRERGIIGGDNDIDLAVFGPENLVRFHQVMQSSNFETCNLVFRDGRPSVLKLMHPNGCRIDIISFVSEPDGSTTWHGLLEGLLLTIVFPHQFDLKQTDFIGATIFMPDRPEEFLDWVYGPGWRTPDRHYNVVTSGPLHGDEHREITRIVGPLAILKTLRDGDPAKGLSMTRSMARLFPEDVLWPRFAEALENTGLVGAVSQAPADHSDREFSQ